MKPTTLPNQPNTLTSYFRVGRLLYGALMLFIIESWIYWVQLKASFDSSSLFWILFWTWSFLFSFIHIFLVIMDGWSRFQNYKRAKDQFYIHGYNNKIALNYMDSKCQRMAATTAAEELGMKDQIDNYYRHSGVKWFHFIPYFMIKDPFFLVKKIFWSRTFLEGHYEPKYDYRTIFKSQTA